MYELVVLGCCRALVTPVPGTTPVRENGMTPRLSVNFSSGSPLLNGMSAAVPFSSRRPKVWSRNCPHVHSHCVARCSEKTFWPRSWKTRLLMNRLFGPLTGWLWPSAYRALVTRGYGWPARPHSGWALLLPLPSRLCTSNPSAADAFRAAVSTVPPASRSAATAMTTDLARRTFRERDEACLHLRARMFYPPREGLVRPGLVRNEPAGRDKARPAAISA